MVYVKYCEQCDKTGENVSWGYSERQKEYYRGYLTDIKDEILADMKCPYHHCDLVETNMTFDEMHIICEASNANRQLLEAMMELKEKDIIEYELKMSQFRNIVEQQEQQEREKQSANQPHCPICNSTNIKKISGLSKAGSIALWGKFAIGRTSKTWHCNNCDSEW